MGINIKTYISKIACVVAMSLAICGCSRENSLEADLQQAEMSVAQGDMRAASSILRHIVKDGKNLSGLPASKLARLSLIYMQIADSMDQSENVALATQCYNQAFTADPDSATQFYSSVSPEHTRYTVMLSALSGNQNNADSIPEFADDAFGNDMAEDSIASHSHDATQH